MKDLVWDKRLVQQFKGAASLTEEECVVLEDWAVGKTIVNTAMTKHMSERKVSYIRRSICHKYDRVQVTTPGLPQRKKRKETPPPDWEGDFALLWQIVCGYNHEKSSIIKVDRGLDTTLKGGYVYGRS